MSNTVSVPQSPKLDYVEIENSPEFLALRAKRRRFVLPVTAGALLWFFAYVIASSYFSDFMATPVFGRVNIGLLLGFGQFFTTFAITTVYVWYANKRLDPLSAALRTKLEAQELAR